MDRGQILQELRARIVAFATSRYKASPADAEDLAQEVLIVMMEKYAHVEDVGDLLGPAFTTLRNKLFNANRKSWRRKEDQIDEEHQEDSELSPEAKMVSQQREHERQRQYERAVRRLKPKCRQLLDLYLEGRKFKDIARSLGEPEGTINARWSRCRKALAKEVRKQRRQEGES